MALSETDPNVNIIWLLVEQSRHNITNNSGQRRAGGTIAVAARNHNGLYGINEDNRLMARLKVSTM